MNSIPQKDANVTHQPILDTAEPEPEGHGEFAETIIDKDGELEPEVLEEPFDDDAETN